MAKPLIGFIGQGWIGKNYADDFERRGFSVVRYALEEPHISNKDRVRECDIVFIAVPTPTTPEGFDVSIVEQSLALVGQGKTAVIKSTIVPGTTRALQKRFPRLFVLHSPEFLVLTRAAADAARPQRTIVGIPRDAKAFRARARAVTRVLPKAPFEIICSSEEAELAKYGGNFFLYLKVLFANLMYEAAQTAGADYEIVRKAMAADPRIGSSHLSATHHSGHRGATTGRGAGGVCFIKDVAAFERFYERVHDPLGSRFVRAAVAKNIELLTASGKDLDLLRVVYGAGV